MPTRTPFAVAFLGIVLSLMACDARGRDGVTTDSVAVERVFPEVSFERPLYFVMPPPEAKRAEEPGRIFIVEQAGRVLWFENRPDVTPKDVTVALDITGRVRRRGNEEGLLGMAFHPDFASNRRVFLHYSASNPRRNVLSRWRFDDAGEHILPDSEEVILEVEQPYRNHNGGHIAFGPDGFLYISLGDGGAAGDPHNHGQDLSTLLGSILRIGVDGAAPNQPYTIPDTNPFINTPGARPEIYAYGLRNTWRFSFDPPTGRLWAGDVGQNRFEEIDLIVKGGNYGWNYREGFAPFRDAAPADRPDDLIPPVLAYGRDLGRSVTGGYVYRGDALPALRGAYVYADFATGRVWALRVDDRGELVSNRQIARVPAPASFGIDHAGELYICSFDGHLYKLVMVP